MITNFFFLTGSFCVCVCVYVCGRASEFNI